MRIFREPLFYLLPLLALTYFIALPTKTEISEVKLTRNNKTENIKLPYSTNMANGEVFFVSFNLSVKNESDAKFKIIPDDCIQEILINGKQFSLDGIKGLCDYSNGAFFDFSKYVHKGLNSFEFRIVNSGGPGGLRVDTLYSGFKNLSLKHYVFTFIFLMVFALILRKFKFKFIVTSIILLGIIVRLVLYTYIGPMQNPYDVLAHLEYIQTIAEEKRIPEINEGWSTYHPPLYYMVSAIVKNIADKYDTSLTNRFLQQFNLLLSFASVVFGVALIISLFGNRMVAYLAALVSVLWPGFVMAAPRIGNDSLFYLGALICMFFAQKYWNFHKNSDMLWATIGASIALAAKSTGFVILGVWVIIYVFNAVRSLKIGSLRTLFASVFIVALFIIASNYRTFVEVFEGKTLALVGNESGLNSGLKVQNAIGNYLYFDLKDHIVFPYTSALQDEGGRQYFWNYAIKTSLFGEIRKWNASVAPLLATMLNVLVLLIFALALWGIIHLQMKDIPSLFFLVSLFAALIYLRVSYPYSCSNEFRYILPVIYPLVYFSVRGLQILQNSRFKILSYVAMITFAGLSFVYIVGQALI